MERNPDYLKGRGLEKGYPLACHLGTEDFAESVYMGMCAQGRVGNKTMHGKPVKKPREEWIIVENTHEALVSAEQWETVQRQMAARRRSRKRTARRRCSRGCSTARTAAAPSRFSAVHRKTMPDGGQYKCWYYMRHGKEYCSSHYVTMDQLTAVVLDDVRRRGVLFAKRYHDRYMDMLAAARLERDARERGQPEGGGGEGEDADGQAGQDHQRSCWSRTPPGTISDERFTSLSAQYEQEYRELEQVVAGMRLPPRRSATPNTGRSGLPN